MNLNQDQVKALMEMMRHPGWGVLNEAVNEHVDRFNNSMASLAVRDDMTSELILARQNYNLGQAVGMKAAMKMPQVLIAGMQSVKGDKDAIQE